MNKKNNKDSLYLYIGVMFLGIGGMFTAMGIHFILNPDLAISCYGESSTDMSCKLNFVVGGGIVLLIGISLLIARYRFLKR